jgi:hypothetical protein
VTGHLDEPILGGLTGFNAASRLFVPPAGQTPPVTGSRISDFLELVGQLPEVVKSDHDRYWRFDVRRRVFGYLWGRTDTVGLKQTLVEQLALVTERPGVFEVQFTSGGFGWVVVHLEGVERDELAELVFEAWRLTAPAELLEARADVLPR